MSSPQSKILYDYIIVGAGLAGSTFAYLARTAGKKVKVIDKRNHTGGNLYCENINGINVHKYGAHIFHTSDKEIWDFVNTLVPFNRFTNSPLACYNGKYYNLPFNMNTFYQMWGVKTPFEAISVINEQKKEAIEQLNNKGYSDPQNLEEQALCMVGNDIYQTLIKGYTEKQWGRKCSDLPPFIIKRLPLRFTFDNNYFNDTYQGIPIGGYNKLIDNLLEGVDVELNVNFLENRAYWEMQAKKIVFTGMIDEYYNYKYGFLEYRSLKFDHENLNISNYQGNAVVNYTDIKVPYTRIIEHKHFEMSSDEAMSLEFTVITKEYPIEWTPGMEPYYPINDSKNEALIQKYQAESRLEKNVIFLGRLAEYKYYDMAPIIKQVKRVWELEKQ